MFERDVADVSAATSLADAEAVLDAAKIDRCAVFVGVGNLLPLSTALQLATVRPGLNAGEPIEEDGDLFGSTVILASRIAAKAGAGEILVPDTMRGVAVGEELPVLGLRRVRAEPL